MVSCSPSGFHYLCGKNMYDVPVEIIDDIFDELVRNEVNEVKFV